MKPQSAAVVCSEETWVRGHGASHPLKPERLRRTYELLAAYGVFDGSHSLLVRPPPAATSSPVGMRIATARVGSTTPKDPC